MVWLAVVAVLLVIGLSTVEVLERRPKRPSEEERQANRLRILEYRRISGVADGRLWEEQRRGG